MVEEAQQNKIRWNYATWQMKVNLIYDMRHDGSGMFGGLSEEDAVIAVLESSRNKVEFWKIVKGLEKANRVERVNIKLDDLVDFSQQSKLDYLRNVKFK